MNLLRRDIFKDINCTSIKDGQLRRSTGFDIVPSKHNSVRLLTPFSFTQNVQATEFKKFVTSTMIQVPHQKIQWWEELHVGT